MEAISRLILYRDFEDGKILRDMSWLREHYQSAGCSREEIAGRTGLSQKSVDNALHRARKKLRDL